MKKLVKKLMEVLIEKLLVVYCKRYGNAHGKALAGHGKAHAMEQVTSWQLNAHGEGKAHGMAW